jgi:hypothetical protein
LYLEGKPTGKIIPKQAATGPERSRRLGAPRFQNDQHALAALTPRKYSWYSSLLEARYLKVTCFKCESGYRLH